MFKNLYLGIALSVLLMGTGLPHSMAQIIASADTSIYCTDTITLNASVVSATGTTVSLSDDVFSGIVNIGFPFIWYGNVYTQCVISSNNFITFDLSNASGYSNWVISVASPSASNPLDAAMGPWQDINPGVGGTITYATVGSAPNRIFVVEYCNIPMFSCTNLAFSSQIQLHENGMHMETHIISKPLCTSWNSGQAIHGTQNSTGVLATIVNGRNAGAQWVAVNEGYRFYQDPLSANYLYSSIPFSPIIVGTAPGAIEWSANGSTITTGPSITVSPSVTTAYVASVSGGCTGINFNDTVWVNVPSAPNIALSATMPSGSMIHEDCGNSVLTFSRTNSSALDTLLIDVTGTATNGQDYPFIPDTVFLQPGVSTYTMNLFAYEDFIIEGQETLHIEAQLTDPCIFNTVPYELILNDLPNVQVTANADTTICHGGTAQLSAIGSGGVFGNPLSYSWSNGPTIPTQAVQPPLTQSYIITVTDSCALRFDSDTVTVTVNPPIYPAAGPDLSICIGDSAQLSGSGAANYHWSPGTYLNDSLINNPVTTPTSSIEYVLVVSDGLCEVSDTVMITVNPLPIVTSTPQNNTICITNSLELTASGAVNYSWSPTNSLSSATGTSVFASPTTTTTYNIIGTDANGCINSTTNTVYVNPPLYIEAYGDTTLCGRSVSTVLSAFGTGGNGGPYNVNWSPEDFLSTTTGFSVPTNPDTSIVYTATITDNCGTPAATDQVTINLLPVPEILVSLSDSDGCAPFDVTFTNLTVDANTSLWEFGNGYTSMLTHPDATFDAGHYDVSLTVTNSYGCTETRNDIHIYASPPANAEFIVNPTVTDMINPRVFFSDRSWSDITRWRWNIGNDMHLDTVPEFYYSFAEPGSYPVTLHVQNAYGCTDELTVQVIVHGALTLYIPNAFSPNDDGINDVFHAEAADISFFNMEIFNRWGELVFSSDDINTSWDGTKNGKPVAQGVYVYRLVAEGTFENSRIMKEGTVTLIR